MTATPSPPRSSSAPKEEGAVAVVVSAKIESEIAVLSPDEQAEYLEAVGLDEPGLNRVIRAGYDLLHLVTYFTVGPKEARAWTITKGTKAPAAAGVIHTDFEKGFIRSETIAYDDYVASRARPARARPASSGWRARNTSCRTATACISASRIEPLPGASAHALPLPGTAKRSPGPSLNCRHRKPGSRTARCASGKGPG